MKTLDDVELKEGLVELLTALAPMVNGYYESNLVLHTDPNYISPEGAMIYIPFTEKEHQNNDETENEAEDAEEVATLNRTRPGLYPPGAPLMVNSWLSHQSRRGPAEEHILERLPTFNHPYMDNAFRNAQMAIEKFQGVFGLYFAGIGAGFNDSHEAALQAAFRALWRISFSTETTNIERSQLQVALKGSVMPEYLPSFVADQLGVTPSVKVCCSC
jgi:hypothetical protein